MVDNVDCATRGHDCIMSIGTIIGVMIHSLSGAVELRGYCRISMVSELR